MTFQIHAMESRPKAPEISQSVMTFQIHAIVSRPKAPKISQPVMTFQMQGHWICKGQMGPPRALASCELFNLSLAHDPQANPYHDALFGTRIAQFLVCLYIGGEVGFPCKIVVVIDMLKPVLMARCWVPKNVVLWRTKCSLFAFLFSPHKTQETQSLSTMVVQAGTTPSTHMS